MLSFTVQEIFDGAKDEPYDTGLSLASAHGGYLARPSLFRRLAEEIEAAKAAGWTTR